MKAYCYCRHDNHSAILVVIGTCCMLLLAMSTTEVSAFQQQQHRQQLQFSKPKTSKAPLQLQLQLQSKDNVNESNNADAAVSSPFRMMLANTNRRGRHRHRQRSRSRRQRISSLLASTSANDGVNGGATSTSQKQQPLVPEFEKYKGKLKLGLLTLLRVAVPSILAGFIAFFAFPHLSMWLCSLFQDQGVFAVLSQDSSQFVQNFLSVSSLLFSILVGQTYYFMYQQQEMVYYALFDEVTEAKSLLEQVALVSQGRSMYQRVLQCMSTYVQTDLKALNKDPAILLSSRPMDDPLETIMYLVSLNKNFASIFFKSWNHRRSDRGTQLFLNDDDESLSWSTIKLKSRSGVESSRGTLFSLDQAMQLASSSLFFSNIKLCIFFSFVSLSLYHYDDRVT